MAATIVEVPVLKMQVGDFIVTQKSHDGLRALKWVEVTKIEPSRKLNWFKVNDKFIFDPCGKFESPLLMTLPPGYEPLLDKEVTLVP